MNLKQDLETTSAPPGSLYPDGSTSARVEPNLSGAQVLISVGSQEVWLTRDEALTVYDALPSAINALPVRL